MYTLEFGRKYSLNWLAGNWQITRDTDGRVVKVSSQYEDDISEILLTDAKNVDELCERFF